jgi:hypothetical protein
MKYLSKNAYLVQKRDRAGWGKAQAQNPFTRLVFPCPDKKLAQRSTIDSRFQSPPANNVMRFATIFSHKIHPEPPNPS